MAGFFKQESWAIGQIYAEPVIVIRDQAYVGGKGIDNRGGSVADFLYKNELSDNCLVVEIKTPTTPLVVKDDATRNHVLNVSRTVTGGVQQLLHYRYTLTEGYNSLSRDEVPEFRIFSPRLLLIVGTFGRLIDNDMRRSFEISRGNLRDVSIVTFDEVVRKAKQLLILLRSTHRGPDTGHA